MAIHTEYGRIPLTVLAITVIFLGFLSASSTSASGSSPKGSWENRLRPAVVACDRPVPHWSLRERMAFYHVPGVAVAVIRDGKVLKVTGYGVLSADSDRKVNADTLFSAGSISKVATATLILRMVASGKLDLDRNIDSYLTSWQVPATKEIPNPDVTLRMLMSHTSGFNVGGFPDFMPQERIPTLLETLDGKPPSKEAYSNGFVV